MERVRKSVEELMKSVQSVVVGQRKVIEMLIATLLAEGHALLEGVPGVGKTLIAKTVAKLLGLEFRRIQMTPDTLPSDIIGCMVFNPQSNEFVLRKGPVFTNILFVDEINRAPPKTQAALLEAMQERQVTIEGNTLVLPRPFMVIATQNPIEMEGTFPLPEAQLDRFLTKIVVEPPSAEELVEIMRRYYEISSANPKPVLSRDEVLEAIEIVKGVYVDSNVMKYIAYLIEEIRRNPLVRLGPSPRGALALYLLSKSIAFLRGRDYVTPDDVKYVALDALRHRVLLRAEARLSGRKPEDVIVEALKRVEPP